MNLCARSPVLLLVRTGLLVSLLPAVLATCRLDDLVSSPDDPALELQVSGVVVGVADSAQLSPAVLVDGVARDDLQLAWSTTDSSIATIDPAGFVRGHARGRAVVTVRLDAGTVVSSDVEASDTVWVVAASLELAPGDTTLTSAGDTVCLRHIARDARGIPLTGTSPTFSVSSDPDSTVTLTQPGGCAVGRTSGRAATLTATLDTATASAAITVRQTVAALSIGPDSTELLNLGDTVRLTADARDRRGEPAPPTLVEWSNSDSAVAVVDSQGVVTAQGAGATVVRGTADGITDSAVILVNPPDLTVTPDEVSASAARGSAVLHTADLAIANAGTGSPSWSAAKSRSWLSLSKSSGGMPDMIRLTLDPAGLPEGTHYDTVVVTAPGASSSPAKVPVTFTITPCAETPIAPDVTLNSVLTTSDCGSPHRPTGFARVYAFSGGVGDTLAVRMEGDFDAYLFVVDAAGTVLAENDECSGNPLRGPACIEDLALPGSGTYTIEATSLDPATTGGFTLRAVFQTAPDAPQTLGQFRSNGTTAIALGAATDETTVVFEGTLTDSDPDDTLRLQVEIQPLGGAFTGTPTATSAATVSGNSVSVTVTDRADNTSFHWQARAIDRTDRPGAWVSYSGNAEGEADFHVNTTPEPPTVPANAGQFKVNGTPIDTGATTDEVVVVFKALLADPDPGDSLRLEVEVQPIGTAFTNSPSAIGALWPRGTVGQVAWPGGVDGTDYHWQVRAIDKADNRSPWVSFGGNLETATDFRVDVP